jgi:hypothetical protein
MFYENLGGFFYHIDLDGLCRLEYVGQNSAGWQEFEVWVWFGDSGIRNASGQQPLEQDGTLFFSGTTVYEVFELTGSGCSMIDEYPGPVAHRINGELEELGIEHHGNEEFFFNEYNAGGGDASDVDTTIRLRGADVAKDFYVFYCMKAGRASLVTEELVEKIAAAQNQSGELLRRLIQEHGIVAPKTK